MQYTGTIVTGVVVVAEAMPNVGIVAEVVLSVGGNGRDRGSKRGWSSSWGSDNSYKVVVAGDMAEAMVLTRVKVDAEHETVI